MNFYGLWTPKGNSEKVEKCLDTGIWTREDCPTKENEKYEKDKIAKIPIGSDVFLYEGVANEKISETPIAQYLEEGKCDLTIVKVKCYSIGKVISTDFENLSIKIDWDRSYRGSEWFSYFRQDGVFLMKPTILTKP